MFGFDRDMQQSENKMIEISHSQLEIFNLPYISLKFL